jgi:hypothetical protein
MCQLMILKRDCSRYEYSGPCFQIFVFGEFADEKPVPKIKKIFILLTKLLDKYIVEKYASENTNRRMFIYKRDVLRYKKVRGK